MPVTFENNSVQVKEAIKNAGLAFLHEAAGELQSGTQRNSRVDTGQTRGSYQYQVDSGALEAQIGSNMENAIWEEFGTGEYALHGDGRKGGWRYVDAKGRGHFTRGKSANRPMFNAFTAAKGKIVRMAEEKFRGLG